VSFSGEVKDELAHRIPTRPCCRRMMLTVFLRWGGRPHRSGGELEWQLRCPTGSQARLLWRLLRESTSLVLLWDRQSRHGRRPLRSYRILLPAQEDLVHSLKTMDILDSQGQPVLRLPARLFGGRCCRNTYLASLFMLRGSVNDPSRSYHLEWVVPVKADPADIGGGTRGRPDDRLLEILGRYQLSAGKMNRGGWPVVYLKGADRIADCLTLMGAVKSRLHFEQIRALKDTKNEVHRRVNCDMANLERAAYAALRQVDAVNTLERAGRLSELPLGLREMARIRLEFPEAGMKELGEEFTPPLSKSAVHHRLLRIEEAAGRVRAAREFKTAPR